MNLEIDKLRLYIQIKWWVLLTTAALIGGELALGVVGIVAASSTFIALAIAACLNLWLNSAVNRIKRIPVLVQITLTFDLLLIILALYLNGGVENTWLFFPAILIFFSGYLFTLRASLTYATISFSAILIMVILEHYRVIPHFSLYNFPELYWRNLSYCSDYLIGLFLLYFFAAFTSGNLNQIMRQSSARLEKNLAGNREIQKTSEENRKALMNVMEDMSKVRDDLELHVAERTRELEEIKNGLEEKVEERTVDLEKSRKAVLHMLRDLKGDVSKLKEVDRMKSEFISVVSHELRTPLTPLMDYASILLEGMAGPTTEKQKEIFQSLLRLSKRELNLINSLLDISRLEVGIYSPNRTPLQLKTLIQDSVMDVQKDAAGKKIAISLEIEDGVSTIMADENLISRLIAQLINNALKFTPEGGSIRIKCVTEGENIKFEIVDNGIGIAKEKIDKLFQKFYQADSTYARKFGGMGLGLAICKQIVEVHKGKIWAESEGLGQGTKFTFILPVKS